MKKKILLLTGSVAVMTLINVVSFKNDAIARPEGVSGHSGQTTTCSKSGCHAGVAHSLTNAPNALLTSDIPQSGYVPGTTYNMILTIKGKKNRMGFNLRAQNASGAIAGTINSPGTGGLVTTSTNTSNTGRIAGELTHSATTISGGQRVITFKWLAPEKGTGDVTYYGSVATGINEIASIDTLNKISVVFKENTVTSLDDANFTRETLSVYPSVAKGQFTVAFEMKNGSPVTIQMYDEKGMHVKDIYNASVPTGQFNQLVSTYGLKNGIYFVHLNINGEKSVKKLIIDNQ